jgi:hypothetical protein
MTSRGFPGFNIRNQPGYSRRPNWLSLEREQYSQFNYGKSFRCLSLNGGQRRKLGRRPAYVCLDEQCRGTQNGVEPFKHQYHRTICGKQRRSWSSSECCLWRRFASLQIQNGRGARTICGARRGKPCANRRASPIARLVTLQYPGQWLVHLAVGDALGLAAPANVDSGLANSGANSQATIARLRIGPHRYPPRTPVSRMTRWHGIK